MSAEEPKGPEARLVLTTAPDGAVARDLARSLIEGRLAACVQCIPGVTSVYRWEGEMEEAQEVLLIIKTTAGRLEALEDAVAAEHPYETPEFVALEPVLVSAPYLAWLRESVAQDEGA